MSVDAERRGEFYPDVAGGGKKPPASEIEACYLEAGLDGAHVLHQEDEISGWFGRKSSRAVAALRRLSGRTESPRSQSKVSVEGFPTIPSALTTEETVEAVAALREHKRYSNAFLRSPSQPRY